MHNFIESSICMGKERVKNPVHPTQKPIKVLSHLINLATNPGSLVLDPFMGVGSTGVAALKLARRFIGIEINSLYFNAAARRIEEITNTPPLFAFGVGAVQETVQKEQKNFSAKESEERTSFELFSTLSYQSALRGPIFG